MATTDCTTTSITHAPKGAIPISGLDPSRINPLIAYQDDLSETAENIKAVLDFMADVLRNKTDGDYIESGDGIGLILATCAAALDFHLAKKGGAQ